MSSCQNETYVTDLSYAESDIIYNVLVWESNNNQPILDSLFIIVTSGQLT